MSEKSSCVDGLFGLGAMIGMGSPLITYALFRRSFAPPAAVFLAMSCMTAPVMLAYAVGSVIDRIRGIRGHFEDPFACFLVWQLLAYGFAAVGMVANSYPHEEPFAGVGWLLLGALGCIGLMRLKGERKEPDRPPWPGDASPDRRAPPPERHATSEQKALARSRLLANLAPQTERARHALLASRSPRTWHEGLGELPCDVVPSAVYAALTDDSPLFQAAVAHRTTMERREFSRQKLQGASPERLGECPTMAQTRALLLARIDLYLAQAEPLLREDARAAIDEFEARIQRAMERIRGEAEHQRAEAKRKRVEAEGRAEAERQKAEAERLKDDAARWKAEAERLNAESSRVAAFPRLRLIRNKHSPSSASTASGENPRERKRPVLTVVRGPEYPALGETGRAGERAPSAPRFQVMGEPPVAQHSSEVRKMRDEE